MSEYYNRQWRLPNNENKDKQSNYSMYIDGGGSNGHIDTNYYLPDGTKPKSMSFRLSKNTNLSHLTQIVIIGIRCSYRIDLKVDCV